MKRIGAVVGPIAETAAGAYHLTQREFDTMLAVCQGHTPRETAARLGLAENTVKHHLKCVFAKTGARRQADLVRMFAGIVSPFVTGTGGNYA